MKKKWKQKIKKGRDDEDLLGWEKVEPNEERGERGENNKYFQRKDGQSKIISKKNETGKERNRYQKKKKKGIRIKNIKKWTKRESE